MVVEGAKGVYFFSTTWSLTHKLITRKIKNLESLVFVFVIKFLQALILWRQTTSCCCIDD